MHRISPRRWSAPKCRRRQALENRSETRARKWIFPLRAFPGFRVLMRQTMRKILLIDDDRLQFRVTQAHFKNFQGDHYQLDWAASYEEGLDKLLFGDYAACLLDYQLGERDGLQLIREAVARGCRTPIVFLTAETAQRVDIEAM